MWKAILTFFFPAGLWHPTISSGTAKTCPDDIQPIKSRNAQVQNFLLYDLVGEKAKKWVEIKRDQYVCLYAFNIYKSEHLQ